MKCVKCGQEISENMRFCPQCGEKVELTHETVQLRCKECGGTLTVGAGRRVLVCPFCQSKEILPESDEVTIQRIKSEAYKAVELEKLRHEKEKDERVAEDKKMAEDSKKAYTGKYGKLAVFCLILAILCAWSTFSAFRSTPIRLWDGMVSALQAVVFFVAWSKGRKNSFGKTRGLHKVLAIAGILMFGIMSPLEQTDTLFPEEVIVEIPSINEETVTSEDEGIYCYPIRNYVGRNAASIGKSQYNYQVDEYGEAELRIVFFTEKGIYIDPNNVEQLQNYIVHSQSIPAESNLIAVTGRYSSGKPSSSIDYQNYEEIILYVHAVAEAAPASPSISAINFSTDRRTYYVRDYVGRNAAAVGPKNRRTIDKYGHGDIKIVFTAEDGTYIESTDLETLRQYVVVAQDIAPNTQITYTYSKYSNGREMDYVDYQNITEINLTVKKLDESVIALMPEITPTPVPEPTPVALTLDYKIQGNKAIITGYYGEGTVVEIPRKLGGKEVTEIGASAFKNCTTLESITIWADLTKIGDSAFEGCTALTDISIPNETTHIGKRAFMNCTSLSTATVWGDPDIDDYAFAGCTSLKSISISNDTKRVGAHAYEGCTGATSLTIWGVEVIEEYAFAGCTGITYVSLPHDVVRVKAHAFDGCIGLTSLTVWDDDTVIDRLAFSNCPHLNSEYAALPTSTTAPTNTPKPTGTPTATPSSTPVPTNTPKPTATPTPYTSIYDIALVRKLGSYSLYYLIDLDGKVARYFSTDDTGVQVGKVSGSLTSGLKITYTIGGSTWSEKLTYSGSSKTRVTLVDANGFSWDYTVTDIATAEKILQKPGYHDMK